MIVNTVVFAEDVVLLVDATLALPAGGCLPRYSSQRMIPSCMPPGVLVAAPNPSPRTRSSFSAASGVVAARKLCACCSAAEATLGRDERTATAPHAASNAVRQARLRLRTTVRNTAVLFPASAMAPAPGLRFRSNRPLARRGTANFMPQITIAACEFKTASKD